MRRLLFTLIVAGAIAAPLAAQQPSAPSRNESAQAAAPSAQTPQASAPAAPQAQAPRAPEIGVASAQRLPGATNLKLEVTLTDTFSGTPVKKTVTMVMLNGYAGMIRTANNEKGAVLNVDAIASAYQTGQISLKLTFEYMPQRIMDANGRPVGYPPSLNESINVVLMDGVTMLLSESADPATDRKVTLEAKATILK